MQVGCECLRELSSWVELGPLEAELQLLATARRVTSGSGVEVHWVRDRTLELSRVLRVTRWSARGPGEIGVRAARQRFDPSTRVGDELLVPLVPFAAVDEVGDELAAFERSELRSSIEAALTRCVAGWLPPDAGVTPRFSIDDSWRVMATLSLEAPRVDQPTPYSLWTAMARAGLGGTDTDDVPDTPAAVVPRIDYTVAQINNGGTSQLLYNGLRAGVSLAGLAAALRRIGANDAASHVDALHRVLPPEAMATFLESDYFGDNAERDAIEAASTELDQGIDAIQRQAVHWLWARREQPGVAEALARAERPEIADAVSSAVQHRDPTEILRLHRAGTALVNLGPSMGKIVAAAAEDPGRLAALLDAGLDPTTVECPRGPLLGAPACRTLFIKRGLAPAAPWAPRWFDIKTVDEVERLFANGVRPSAQTLAEQVWSHARELEANVRLIRRAGELGITLDDAADRGAQALQNALERPALVDAMLDSGVDPNARSRDGGAALHYVEQGATVDRLVTAGADPNVPSTGPLREYGNDGKGIEARFFAIGSTPLDVAEARNRDDVAEALRAHGARAGTQHTWAVIVYARGSEDAALLERLGDTPELRATLGRIPRTSDAPVLHGRCLAKTASRSDAETLAKALSDLGASTRVV